jgi:lambda family phage portal protein
MIDPDRLSNPQQQFDLPNTRGGVEIDQYGAAVAYQIRQAHQSDWMMASKSVTWTRIQRETSWGRPIIVHNFDVERAGQHRGGVGILGPVVQRLKALIRYDGAELDAAILNAIFAAYIESPHDPEMVEQALGADELNKYQSMRADYHSEKRLTMQGARMPILFPGEKINAVEASRPSGNYAGFEKAMLRNVAAAGGMSAQQVSNDWSDVNYSSARGAALEAWKTLDRRKRSYGIGFAGRVRSAWLEECHEVDDLPMPRNAPDFVECRSAYGRAKWLGPARGWLDPVAEKEGAVLGMEAGLSTLEAECADQNEDWEENLDQRARELEGFKRRGLEPPASWLANRPASVARAPGEGKDIQ